MRFHSIRAALICVPAALLLPVNACDAGGAADKFGALAISPSTGKFGAVIDRLTREDAEKDAAGQCGQADCNQLVVWFKNACVAVAQGAQAGKVFGSTAQPTEKAAVDEAVGTCTKSTSGCKSVGTFCTTR